MLVLDSHKEDLKFLREQPPGILADFCKLSSNFLSKGGNMKHYSIASQKLQVDIKQIQNCVEALAYLFVEAKRHDLDEDGFKKSVLDLGLPESFSQPIFQEYLSVKSTLDSALPEVGIQHYQFKNLEWRFEAQVSSRAMPNLNQPKVIMKFQLEKNSEKKNICLQSNIPNLIHMCQQINMAMQDFKSNHSKRIVRSIT